MLGHHHIGCHCVVFWSWSIWKMKKLAAMFTICGLSAWDVTLRQFLPDQSAASLPQPLGSPWSERGHVHVCEWPLICDVGDSSPVSGLPGDIVCTLRLGCHGSGTSVISRERVSLPPPPPAQFSPHPCTPRLWSNSVKAGWSGGGKGPGAVVLEKSWKG